MRLIEMLGLPGSGKTTIARLLEERLNLRAKYEAFQQNRFLKATFQNRRAPSLENSLFFLLDYLEAFYAYEKDEYVIYDSGLILDCAYSAATLIPNERMLFDDLSQYFLEVGFTPYIVIRLCESEHTCWSRIALRGPENFLTFENLAKLQLVIEAASVRARQRSRLIEIEPAQTPEAAVKEIIEKLIAVDPYFQTLLKGRR